MGWELVIWKRNGYTETRRFPSKKKALAYARAEMRASQAVAVELFRRWPNPSFVPID